MKKQMGYALLLIISVSALAAQQITRFAVVDTAQVYNTFFRDSTAVRNYEAKKLEYQNEINRLTEELRTLQLNKLELEKAGDMTAAVKLETEISRRAGFLTEYTKAKNVELDTLKKKLNSDDEFYIAFYDAIGRVAESDGYSLVLSLQDANAVLWYSPTVNITEKVITRNLIEMGRIARISKLAERIYGREVTAAERAGLAFLGDVSDTLTVVDESDKYHSALGIKSYGDEKSIKKKVDAISKKRRSPQLSTLSTKNSPATNTLLISKLLPALANSSLPSVASGASPNGLPSTPRTSATKSSLSSKNTKSLCTSATSPVPSPAPLSAAKTSPSKPSTTSSSKTPASSSSAAASTPSTLGATPKAQ